MKKSIYFLWIVVTAVIGSVWLSGCNNDDPEPEPEITTGFIYDIQISPLADDGPLMIKHGCPGPFYHGFLAHNTSSFTFKANPTKNTKFKSLSFNAIEWMQFSDIKDGTYTFECGAKLTMISDTEFVVTDLPTNLPQAPNWKYFCMIMLDMTPSYTFISRDSQIVETNVFEGDKSFSLQISLDYDFDE